MSISFERCVGPHKDVRELEYICALQQTSDDIRFTGTVTAKDIICYLRSRHGLEVDLPYMRDVFMPGLAGALADTDNPVFDIVELACMLLIPHFKQQAKVFYLAAANTAANNDANTGGTQSNGGGGADSLTSSGTGQTQSTTVSFEEQVEEKEEEEEEEEEEIEEDLFQDEPESAPIASGSRTRRTRPRTRTRTRRGGRRRRRGAVHVQSKQKKEKDEKHFFQLLHEIIVRDLEVSGKIPTRSRRSRRNSIIQPAAMDLTPELMESILDCYGEGDTVRPEDIRAMLQAAAVNPQQHPSEKTEAIPFTPQTLARACTADLGPYRVDWEDTDSTHFDDVFQGTYLDDKATDIASIAKMVRRKRKKIRNKSIMDKSMMNASSRIDDHHQIMEEKAQVKKIATFASIDGIAENYRSIFFSVIIWLCLVVLYWAFVYGENSEIAPNAQLSCDSFFCRVANDVIRWAFILLQLATMGSLFVILGSAGNSIYAKHDLRSHIHLLTGMAFIFFVCVMSYILEVKSARFGFNTERNGEGYLEESTGVFIIILGSILLLFQFKTLLAIGLPKTWYQDNELIQELLVSDMGNREGKTKKAAQYKVDKMVKNALAMHQSSTSLLTRSNSTISPSSGRNLGHGWQQGNALLAFEALSNERETIGGILWTARSMWDGSLFEEEGIWLHARLWACNCAQVMVVLFFATVLPGLYYQNFLAPQPEDEVSGSLAEQAYEAAMEQAEYWKPYVEAFLANFNEFDATVQSLVWNETDSKLVSDFASEIINSVGNKTLYSTLEELDQSTLATVADMATQLLATQQQSPRGRRLNPLYISSILSRMLQEQDENEYNNDDLMEYYEQTQEYYEETRAYWVPESWQWGVSFIVGSIAAVAVTLVLAIVWLPSSVSTILRFRSGTIGSLRDKDFWKYRKCLDHVSILFGSTFWGSLASGLLLFVSFGSVTFLFVWEPSQDYMIKFASQLLAISITLGLKSILLMCVSGLFCGLYRSNPAWSSFLMVVLECWSLGTTVATIATRLVMLILLAATYVGRLDTAIFAKGVDTNVFGLLEDRYPVLLRKDLLLHEAHRHPFIERLGTIYMLKIKHGEHFGRAPESAWRLILTLALMPWLRKFRYDEDEYDEDGNPISNNDEDEGSSRRHSMLHESDELAVLRQRVFQLERQNRFLMSQSEEEDGFPSGDFSDRDSESTNPSDQGLSDDGQEYSDNNYAMDGMVVSMDDDDYSETASC